jgi:acyl dehydratase
VTEADHHLFCLLTMNHQPLHINEVYAKRSQHGRNVVVGTLVYSLAVTEFKRLVLVPRKPE